MPDVARTLDLPPGQRFDYWKHVLSDTFVPLEVSSPGGEADFRGRLRGCELGSLRLIEVQAEPHTARRTARLVKAAPAGRRRRDVDLDEGDGRAGRDIMTGSAYTASTALLEAMREAGARYAFANLGSDHTGIMEAYAHAKGSGTLPSLPELILCPHEFVALSAAHGYAQVSGEPQVVLVHTDCGTQNLGGAIHNASRGRVPVLIFAGLSPATQQGELPGTRSEHIHWLQDSADQRGILRGYAKYDHEIRTGRNVKLLVHRAMQLARSEPAGPVYLTAAREVLEEELPPQPPPGDWWAPVAPAALADEVADEIAAALEDAWWGTGRTCSACPRPRSGWPGATRLRR